MRVKSSRVSLSQGFFERTSKPNVLSSADVQPVRMLCVRAICGGGGRPSEPKSGGKSGDAGATACRISAIFWPIARRVRPGRALRSESRSAGVRRSSIPLDSATDFKTSSSSRDQRGAAVRATASASGPGLSTAPVSAPGPVRDRNADVPSALANPFVIFQKRCRMVRSVRPGKSSCKAVISDDVNSCPGCFASTAVCIMPISRCVHSALLTPPGSGSSVPRGSGILR